MDVTSYLLGKQAGGGSTPTLQNKSVTITENGTTNVTADTGYDGLSQVEVITNVSGGTSEYNTLIDTIGKTSGTIINSIKEIGNLDTSDYTNMYNMFSGCSSLETVALLDTSNVTTMNGMFYNCTNLTNIPQFNTSKVEDFGRMFNNIGNKLTNESLNNILGMCVNATLYTGTKTLAAMSLNEYRAPSSRLQAQSNYQDFIDAGWTIGY